MLRCRTLEQRANLAVGLTILGRRGLWKVVEQGRCGGDVLARPGEASKGFIIGDDPSVYIMGQGTCTPIVSAAFELSIELRALLHKLDSGFLDLLLLGFQLLHPHARWGRCLPFSFVAEVAHRASLLHGDAFDVSLGGTRHEALPGGVMAPPAGVRARGRPWLLYEEVVERFRDVFDYPHELVVRGR